VIASYSTRGKVNPQLGLVTSQDRGDQRYRSSLLMCKHQQHPASSQYFNQQFKGLT
jgi:hypothetical protein